MTRAPKKIMQPFFGEMELVTNHHSTGWRPAPTTSLMSRRTSTLATKRSRRAQEEEDKARHGVDLHAPLFCNILCIMWDNLPWIIIEGNPIIRLLAPTDE